MIKPSFEILNQKGTPMFYSDVYANIPTAGIVGRMFISTDTYAFYRDTGSGWDLIGGPGTGTITGSGASGQVSFFSGSSVLSGSNNFAWDNTNNILTITGNTKATKFVVGSPTDTTRAFAAAGNNDDIALYLEEYGNVASSADVFFVKGRGSISSKSNVQVDDSLGGFGLSGYLNNSTNVSVNIYAKVSNLNTTDNIADADFVINQTYNSTTLTENFRLAANGGNLAVRGTITGTINALATAGTTFLTQTSGLIQSRTAAQVRSDIGAQAALTNPVTGTGTNNEIAYFNTTGSTIGSLTTATYPSLTELSYVKGVTSALQTQLNNKLSLSGGTLTGTLNGTSIALTGSIEVANGQYFQARRSSSNLLINLLGIESGTDNTRLLITGDFNIKNGSGTTLFNMTTGALTRINTTNAYTSVFSVQSAAANRPAIKAGYGGVNANGYWLLGDNYTLDESLMSIGLQYGSGNTLIGQLVAPSTSGTGFISTQAQFGNYGAAIVLQNDGIVQFYSGSSTSVVAVGSAKSMNTTIQVAQTGNLLINTTTDAGQKLYLNGSIRIDGQRSATAGGASGQHLTIVCDGTTYKIALLNN